MSVSKQYLIMSVSYIVIFITIWFSFKEFDIKADISNIVFLSIMPTFAIKGLFDIKYKTGNPKYYVFNEDTNQKLRYLAFFVELGFTIFLFYIHIYWGQG